MSSYCSLSKTGSKHALLFFGNFLLAIFFPFKLKRAQATWLLRLSEQVVSVQVKPFKWSRKWGHCQGKFVSGLWPTLSSQTFFSNLMGMELYLMCSSPLHFVQCCLDDKGHDWLQNMVSIIPPSLYWYSFCLASWYHLHLPLNSIFNALTALTVRPWFTNAFKVPFFWEDIQIAVS